MPIRKLPREEVLGRYRLIARLGHGGMADVFLARRAGMAGPDRFVAIKRMLPIVSRDRTFIAMFLNEGRIAARLDHPNVCRVHEFDQADGTLFLVMEYLHGLAWSEIVPAIPDRPHATLARFVVGVIAQACDGLHHAHTAVGDDGKPHPIVHRDVSPSNLFVTDEGVVKLLDFGVSKVSTEATATSLVKGKLPYLAPEQLKGERVDARADIFALAVVTWEALAGRALFDRGSAYETMLAVAEARIPALPAGDPAIERLDAVLRRALARDRSVRHGSARELADDLNRAIAAHGPRMFPIEIQTHVSRWLRPSLTRRSRDLADLGSGARPPDDMTGERTLIHQPPRSTGMRLRDIPVVVDGAFAARANESTAATLPDTVVDQVPNVDTTTAASEELTRPRAAAEVGATSVGMAMDTITYRMPAPASDADLASLAPSGERTRPREAPAALVGRPPWVSTITLSTPWRLRRRRRLLVVAAVAILAAVIARLLA